MCKLSFPFQLYPFFFPLALNKSYIQAWTSLVQGNMQWGLQLWRSWSPLVPWYQLNWATEQDFALWKWNARMRLGALPLALLCFSVTVRESSTHTPSMSHSANTTIVLSCPKVLNYKVQIWLWIFFPKILSCSDIDSNFVWSLCRRGQSWYITKASCLPRENPTLHAVIIRESGEENWDKQCLVRLDICKLLSVCWTATVWEPSFPKFFTGHAKNKQ